MGTPVPDEWPGLEDDKWYYCTTDLYNPYEGDFDCTGAYWGRGGCCRLGLDITLWLSEGLECDWYHPLCIPYPPADERIICIMGPYDSEGECEAT